MGFTLTSASGNAGSNTGQAPQTKLDTFNNLINSIGTAGELASSSDIDAIVQFNGVSAPGKVFTPVSSIFGEPTANIVDIFPPSLTGYLPINQLIGESLNQSQFMAISNSPATNFKFSFDGINWITSLNTPSSVNCVFATNNSTVIAIGNNLTAWTTTNFGVTWTAYASNTSGTANAAFSPICLCNSTAGVAIKTGSSSDSVILPFSGNLTALSMPSTATWATPVACEYLNLEQTKSFAVSYVVNSTTFAVLKGATPAWSNQTLPAALGASPIVKLTNSQILVLGNSGSTTAYLANYSANSETVSSWTTITLPIAPIAVASNLSYFFILSSAGLLYFSKDGKYWQKVNIEIPNGQTFTNLISFSGGIIAKATSYAIIIRSEKDSKGLQKISTSTMVYPLPSGLLINPSSSSKLVLTSGKREVSYLPGTTAATSVTIGNTTSSLDITTATNTLTAITLPIPVSQNHQVKVRLKNAQSSITISPSTVPSGQTINGSASLTLTGTLTNAILVFVYCNGDWWLDYSGQTVGKCTVNWTQSADTSVTGYYIYYSTNPHPGGIPADYEFVVDIAGRTTESAIITGLTIGQTYYFNISSHGSGGHDVFESDLLGEISLVAQP